MQQDIRNFCIIAHIDHGKSTLADRMLQITHAVPEREFRDQMLDDMDLERERGITIKASAVTMFHQMGGHEYQLNLIDTPGHVDFSYEVSRTLKACEGAVLLVDAVQGIEAQTVANLELAREEALTIIPAVTKIDLPTARTFEVMDEMEISFGFDADAVLTVSGKTGENVEELLREIINRVPAPCGQADHPLRALVFDSFYDDYQGVIVYIRVVDGSVSSGEVILMMGSGRRYEVDEVGIFGPAMRRRERLNCGDVGYLVAGIKNIRDVSVGDTVTLARQPARVQLKQYREPRAMVYCGFFPQDSGDFAALRTALQRLSLNDSSFVFQPEASDALGFGFRCGFLGLLHMDIVRERLERESGISVIQTAPNVTYEVVNTKGETRTVDRPSEMSSQGKTGSIREPWVRVSIIVPAEYIGNVMKLAEGRRGRYRSNEVLGQQRVIVVYEIPLAEIVYDFFDRLKSVTRGYGTMDYELLGYRESDLVKVDVLVNKSPVDALSIICHRTEARARGRKIVQMLRKKIQRHLFPVALQAAIGSDVVARETISALRKDVIAKCSGGDVTRKRKLLEKQKLGKRKMKTVGNVQIPQEAFLSVLEVET